MDNFRFSINLIAFPPDDDYLSKPEREKYFGRSTKRSDFFDLMAGYKQICYSKRENVHGVISNSSVRPIGREIAGKLGC